MAASLAEVALVMAGDESLRFCTHLSRLTLVYCQLVRCPFHFICTCTALHSIPFRRFRFQSSAIFLLFLSFFLPLEVEVEKARAQSERESGLALAEGRSGGRGIRTAIVQAGYLG